MKHRLNKSKKKPPTIKRNYRHLVNVLSKIGGLTAAFKDCNVQTVTLFAPFSCDYVVDQHLFIISSLLF